MKIPIIKQSVSGELTVWRHRNGKRELVCKKKNLILNGRLTSLAGVEMGGGLAHRFFTFDDGAANYQDLDGTWNQTGNTVTRASGSGTFPSSPSQIGNELQWEDGERCHVVSRSSDTEITVSGPPRSLEAKTIRRWLTNRSSTAGNRQLRDATVGDIEQNHTTGVTSRTYHAVFFSATVAYTLRSVMIGTQARVVISPEVEVDIDDQLEMSYTITHTNGNRTFEYELGSEATGLPRKYAINSIEGDGTNVDVTFSAATPFLAGDKLDLRQVVPRRFAISSASSTSTTLTINTVNPHGLSVSDSVVIEGASVAGYNGTFTVATVEDADTITITDASNPGAMGASGTIRLATPGTYFDDLGIATIASMVSSSVARITSAITGPDVDLQPIGSSPMVRYDVWGGATYEAGMGGFLSGSPSYINATDEKAIPAPEVTGSLPGSGFVSRSSSLVTNATSANDFTYSVMGTWNAGSGEPRIKQIYWQGVTNQNKALLTFDTPQNKTIDDRLQATASVQIIRELSE